VDVVFVLIRFALYAHHGYPARRAATEICAVRGILDEDPKPKDNANEDPKPGRLLSLEKNPFLFYLFIIIGLVL
jgi:hypothetical protein